MRDQLQELMKIHNLSPSHKKSAIDGLVRIQYALHSSLSQQAVRKSFSEAGICLFDMEKMLGQCKTKMTLEEQVKIIQAIPELMERFDQSGELFEKDFDDYGIRESYKNSDNLIVSRR
jgi:hypothetical protein